MTAEPSVRPDLFAHAPFRQFRKDPSPFVRRRLQPELYLTAADLRDLRPGGIEDVARVLDGAGLGCTVHAPFHDLNPGALDEEVRLLTAARHRSVLGLAAALRARAVVFHPGWDRWRYDGAVERWLRGSVRTWEEVLPAAEDLPPGTRILLENIFDEDPAPLAALFERVPHPRLGFCFDTGHCRLFGSVPPARWLDVLGHLLGEVHLHDNDGSRDQHLPPGEGTFPFDDLWRRLGSGDRAGGPILTLEAHTEADLDRSLAWLTSHERPSHEPNGALE